MKFLLLAFLCFAVNPPTFAQNAAQKGSLEKEFPLIVTIKKSTVINSAPNDPERMAQANSMGIAPPIFVIFRGDIDGENHWNFDCRKENSLRESIPCAPIPAGKYYGRWIYDRSMIQIVNGSSQDPISRFMNVSADPKNPPAKGDPAFQETPYNFPVRFPKGKSLSDYVGLVHVYGGVSMELPAGRLPGRENCSVHDWSTYQTSVNCTSFPPVEIHHGYVTLEISTPQYLFASLHCEARWRWSHCAVLDPGLYYARIDRHRLILLTHKKNGKPEEVGFEMRAPRTEVQSPVK